MLKLDPFLATIEDANGAEKQVIATALTKTPFDILVMHEDGTLEWVNASESKFAADNADIAFAEMRDQIRRRFGR